VLLLVAPPALGSFAASRQASPAAPSGGDPGGAFPPLAEPVGGAVPLPVSEFVTRALYDQGRSLAGARVRLLGFAAPEEGGGYLLTRFNLFCCAADGQAYQVEVRGDGASRPADQWLVVEGRWLPQRVFAGIAPSGVVPVLKVDSVTPVRPRPTRTSTTSTACDHTGAASSCNCIARLPAWEATRTGPGTRSSSCAGRACG
jgi:uncharacterized repeat protein (TIGR03943 family)